MKFHTILSLVATALLGLLVWGCMGLTRHVIVAVDKWGDASPAATLVKVNATLDAVNAPCVDFHGSWTCGPIQQLSQTEKNVGILAARSAQQVQQTGILVTAVANNLNTAGDSVKEVSAHLSKVADAGTGTLDAATTDLQQLSNPKTGLTPLFVAYTQTGLDVDVLLKENALDFHETLGGIRDIAKNTASITGSVDKMTSHLETEVDSKKPLWKTALPMAETGGKIYACLVHHICVN